MIYNIIDATIKDVIATTNTVGKAGAIVEGLYKIEELKNHEFEIVEVN